MRSVSAIFDNCAWSGRLDSNQRPLGPEPPLRHSPQLSIQARNPQLARLSERPLEETRGATSDSERFPQTRQWHGGGAVDSTPLLRNPDISGLPDRAIIGLIGLIPTDLLLPRTHLDSQDIAFELIFPQLWVTWAPAVPEDLDLSWAIWRIVTPVHVLILCRSRQPTTLGAGSVRCKRAGTVNILIGGRHVPPTANYARWWRNCCHLLLRPGRGAALGIPEKCDTENTSDRNDPYHDKDNQEYDNGLTDALSAFRRNGAPPFRPSHAWAGWLSIEWGT